MMENTKYKELKNKQDNLYNLYKQNYKNYWKI